MGTMKTMGPNGHSTLTWDPKDKKETKTAMDAFESLVAQGHRGIEVTGPGESEIMQKWDPEAEEIIVIRPMAGGC